jgi:ssDNA-binding Zn-finger/Zn-ribbon topoisomerase 1
MKNCENCGKSSKMAGTRILLRGHYNPTNWTRKYPNLQKTVNPAGEKVVVCANCIRTFGKEARMKERKAKVAATAAAKAAEPATATK